MLKLRDIENCKLKFKNDNGVHDFELKELIENIQIEVIKSPKPKIYLTSTIHFPGDGK